MRQSLLAFLLLLTPVALAQNPLRDAAAQGVSSIAWKIETGGVFICCCNDAEGFTINHGDRNRIEYDQILLVARLENRKVTRVRMKEPSCPLDAGTRFIANITPDASIDFLLDHLTGEERIVAAVAMHDHPRVVPELIRLARHHSSTKVRRDAVFWLGQKAGDQAAAELQRVVDQDPEDKVREHAVFAISQLPRERSVPILIDLVKTHRRPAVRKKAMFWLAQTNDPRALDLIEEILLR
jgi:hypothetical protein